MHDSFDLVSAHHHRKVPSLNSTYDLEKDVLQSDRRIMSEDFGKPFKESLGFSMRKSDVYGRLEHQVTKVDGGGLSLLLELVGKKVSTKPTFYLSNKEEKGVTNFTNLWRRLRQICLYLSII